MLWRLTKFDKNPKLGQGFCSVSQEHTLLSGGIMCSLFLAPQLELNHYNPFLWIMMPLLRDMPSVWEGAFCGKSKVDPSLLHLCSYLTHSLIIHLWISLLTGYLASAQFKFTSICNVDNSVHLFIYTVSWSQRVNAKDKQISPFPLGDWCLISIYPAWHVAVRYAV